MVVPKYLNCSTIHSIYYLSLSCNFVLHAVLKTLPHFSVFTSSPFTLLATIKAYYVFLCSIYVSIQYTNVTSMDQKLMCTM